MFGTQVINCQLAATKLKQTGRNIGYAKTELMLSGPCI
jgi:hypothetical protein